MRSADRAVIRWVALLAFGMVSFVPVNAFHPDLQRFSCVIPSAIPGCGMNDVMAQVTGKMPQEYEVGFESDTYEIGPGESVVIPVWINDTRLIRQAFMMEVYYPLTILTYTGDYQGGDIDTTLFLVHQPDPNTPLIKVGGVIGSEKSGNKDGSGGPGTIVSLVFKGRADTEGCGDLTLRLMDDLEGARISKGRVCRCNVESHE